MERFLCYLWLLGAMRPRLAGVCPSCAAIGTCKRNPTKSEPTPKVHLNELSSDFSEFLLVLYLQTCKACILKALRARVRQPTFPSWPCMHKTIHCTWHLPVWASHMRATAGTNWRAWGALPAPSCPLTAPHGRLHCALSPTASTRNGAGGGQLGAFPRPGAPE